MRTSLAHPRLLTISRCLACILFLLALGINWLTAQPPAKQPPREEQEETTPKPRRTQPLRVEDDDPAPPKVRPEVAAPAAVDLAAEAARARNPFVSDLYRGLAVPHDRILFATPPRTELVEPLRKHVVLKPSRPVSVKLRCLDEKFEHNGKEYTFTLTNDQRLIYYEQLAGDRVEEFLQRKLEAEQPTSRNYLSRAAMLREAERVLVSVVRFHESARERGLREGNEWEEVAKRLREKLRDVQLRQLALLTDARDWEGAAALGAHLDRAYPDDVQVRAAYTRVLVQQADQSLREQDYRTARFQLERLLQRFPNSKEAEKLRDRLQKKSTDLLAEADKLMEQGKKQEAGQKLQEAEVTWPYSAELRSYRLRLGSAYSVLRVGVRALPQALSPASAVTEVEKQALDLLFEGLVKYRAHATGGPRYEPVLAAELPRLTPLGREFPLLRQALWSNGQRVFATDVAFTLRLLSARETPGRAPGWLELFDRRNPVSVTGDAFQVKLNLGQGYLDPLSLMTFKVLPELDELKRADDPAFAKKPVGSGPYRYEGVTKDEAHFVANSFYGTRPGKSGQPRIGEMRFVVAANPAADFTEDRLHLLLDPPTAVAQQLQTAGPAAVRVQTLRNRRIWFLAVNHRRPALQDVRLRRALALVINREQVLNECFRAGMTDVHRPLNGPYPPSSWASNPKVMPADPYQPDLARPLAQQAMNGRSGGLKLRLTYPAGDDAVRAACELIRKQVIDLKAGLDLELVERGAADLRREVEEKHQYDLAYCSWDYPDHTFWLWPLFDPQGGRNVLGYQNDAELEGLFRQLLGHRQFARVQELTHQIHAHIHAQMPLIPLWQLDTHLAIHPRLELPPGPLDAQAIFSDVDQWKLHVR